jgi:hypothetical protein
MQHISSALLPIIVKPVNQAPNDPPINNITLTDPTQPTYIDVWGALSDSEDKSYLA